MKMTSPLKKRIFFTGLINPPSLSAFYEYIKICHAIELIK